MQLLSRLAIAGLAASGAAALATSASAQQNVRMATSWGGGPHLEVMAKGFAGNVALLTDGKVKIEVFPAGTIGSPSR